MPLVLGWVYFFSVPSCAAQDLPPLSASIANHQSSITLPFVPALATTGWIPVEVRINGKGPYVFVLDTGAEGRALARTVAVALDLPLNGKTQIITPSKAILAAEQRTARTAQLSTATLHNLSLYVLDLPTDFPAQGILGADFLAQFVITVDYERHSLTLTLPDKSTYNGQAAPLPFTINENGNPVVAASIEGVLGHFMMDTGSNGGLDLSPSFAQKYHLPAKYSHHVEYRGGIELAGTPSLDWFVRADTLMLGKTLPVHDIIVDLMHSASTVDGIIGSDILRQFTLTIDWSHQRFYLEKNALYGRKIVFNRMGFIPTTIPEGFQIVYVIPNSPATDAGLRVGDRLVEIAGQPAQTWTIWRLRDLAHGEPGTKLSLVVERDGKRLPIALTLRDLL